MKQLRQQKRVQTAQHRRQRRVRARIAGTAVRPRLAIFRSLRHVTAQIIDDTSGRTLISASDVEAKARGAGIARASAVGKLIATKALAKKITAVVFDRRRYKYHGQVKALADAARSAGLTL